MFSMYKYNMKNIILKNSLFGALTFGLFTYFVEIFETHPNYLKISAFLWAAPLFFFFIMVYLPSTKGKLVLQSFIIHALLGTLLSVLVFLITLVMRDYPIYTVLLFNVFVSILATCIYLITLV